MKKILLSVFCAFCAFCGFDASAQTRVITRTNDVRTISAFNQVAWFAGEAVQYNLTVRQGGAAVTITNPPVWCATDGTLSNIYVLSTGTVVNATNGQVRFSISSAQSALRPVTYQSFASSGDLVCDRVGIQVWGNANFHGAYVGPLSLDSFWARYATNIFSAISNMIPAGGGSGGGGGYDGDTNALAVLWPAISNHTSQISNETAARIGANASLSNAIPNLAPLSNAVAGIVVPNLAALSNAIPNLAGISNSFASVVTNGGNYSGALGTENYRVKAKAFSATRHFVGVSREDDALSSGIIFDASSDDFFPAYFGSLSAGVRLGAYLMTRALVGTEFGKDPFALGFIDGAYHDWPILRITGSTLQPGVPRVVWAANVTNEFNAPVMIKDASGSSVAILSASGVHLGTNSFIVDSAGNVTATNVDARFRNIIFNDGSTQTSATASANLAQLSNAVAGIVVPNLAALSNAASSNASAIVSNAARIAALNGLPAAPTNQGTYYPYGLVGTNGAATFGWSALLGQLSGSINQTIVGGPYGYTNHIMAYSTNEQPWTVPAGCTSVVVLARGAGGGGATQTSCGLGGQGAAVRDYITTTPGETLTIRIGIHGSSGCVRTNASTFGWVSNSSFYGGFGGISSGSVTKAGSGGGCTLLLRGTNILTCAGGGGGAGAQNYAVSAGYGGPVGQTVSGGGQGGSATAGGTNGVASCNGGWLVGGNGIDGSITTAGGGGGNGTFGGSGSLAGGAGGGGGGGGGSFYTSPYGSATYGVNSGDPLYFSGIGAAGANTGGNGGDGDMILLYNTGGL